MGPEVSLPSRLMPSETFAHTVDAAAPPVRVWATLQEAGTWGGFGPIEDVSEARHRADGILASFRWSLEAGGRRWEGTAETTEAAPPEHMAVGLDTREIRGAVSIRLAPAGAGTRATISLRLEAVGMLARLFWRPITRAIAADFPDQTGRFAEMFGAPG